VAGIIAKPSDLYARPTVPSEYLLRTASSESVCLSIQTLPFRLPEHPQLVTEMADQKNIVVLGASFAGMQVAHYILQHLVSIDESFHVYVVDPSPEFYHRVAGPRAVLNDKLIPESAQFLNISAGLKQYPNGTFVEGKATSIDVGGRSIDVTLSQDGNVQTIPYHALIIATGASTPSPLFSPAPTSAETRTALRKFREALPSAKTVVIAGGGPVGVETAGEIGEYLNGSPGWFSSPPKKARVVLLTASDKLLPVLRADVAKQAEIYLSNLGVEVLYKTKMLSTSPSTAGTSLDTVAQNNVTVELSNGEKIQADLFVPAMGVTPNSSFVPKELLDQTSRVKTNNGTLRVDDAGPRVYSLGDVSSASPGGIVHLLDQFPVLFTNLKRDLLASKAGKDFSTTGKDKIYVPGTKATQIVPIGRSKGVGQIFGWWAPSIMVWAVKGRDYMLSGFPGLMGGKTMAKEIAWKDL
jgi:NADH dehydrogenase FAD-containing subunit